MTRKEEVEGRNRKRGKRLGGSEGGNERVVEKEIRREEVMNPLKKMKRFKVAGLNDIERVC